MRRYGYSGYGGSGFTRFPTKTQPDAFPNEFDRATFGDLPVLPTPADILPLPPRARGEFAAVAEAAAAAPSRGDTSLASEIARQMEHSIVPNYDGMLYVEFVTINVPLGSGNVLALLRPTTKRVYLQIFNSVGDGGQRIEFGKPPNAFSLTSNAGTGHIWEVRVPQNDIWLQNTGLAATFTIIYSELDPRAANRLQTQTGPRSPAPPASVPPEIWAMQGSIPAFGPAPRAIAPAAVADVAVVAPPVSREQPRYVSRDVAVPQSQGVYETRGGIVVRRR